MIPRLRDELDLSYFDPQFTQEVTPVETPVEESGMRASVTGGLFDGFTYDQTAAEAARMARARAPRGARGLETRARPGRECCDHYDIHCPWVGAANEIA
jgi:hypothetical protein